MNKYEKYYKDTMTAVYGLAFTVGALILIGILTILGLLNPVWNWVSIGATLTVLAIYTWTLCGQIAEARTYKQLAEMEEDPEEES